MDIVPLYLEDCNKFYLDDKKSMYLQGFSKAGDRTGFMLFPHKILFDCGVRSDQAPSYILNTHCHIDHIGELPYICNKHKLQGRPSYEVYTPETTINVVTHLVKSIACASNPTKMELSCDDILLNQRIKLNPVNAGDVFMIKNYSVEVLCAHHEVQSVGYGISNTVKKLKPEYTNCTKQEILDLKKNNVELTNCVSVPEIAFYCDSTINNLTDHTEWHQYPIIVCECTGLDEKNAIDRGHTGIKELLPVMLKHPDKLWVIIHTSRRLDRNMMIEKENELKSLGLNVKVIG